MSNTAEAWDVSRRGGKIAERLARHIVDEILAAGRQPGDRLPLETEMVETYRVGRATLREALRLLEVQGLVHMKPGPGGGPVVGHLSAKNFAAMAKLHLQVRGSTYREVLQARLAIEPMIARLAAENIDPEGREELRVIVEDSRAGDLDNEVWWHRNSNAFHETVAHLCGNSVLDLLCVGIRDIYTTRIHGAITPGEMRHEVRDTHAAIADAIAGGRADDAERLMREHMADFARQSQSLHSISLDQTIIWD